MRNYMERYVTETGKEYLLRKLDDKHFVRTLFDGHRRTVFSLKEPMHRYHAHVKGILKMGAHLDAVAPDVDGHWEEV
jgi:hypothetical protein